MKVSFCLFALFPLIAGCSLLPGKDDGPGDLSLEELRSAPTTISVDGKSLSLSTYMWRDFMPISPPDGKALVAIFVISTADASPIPDGLNADAAWVVNDTNVWSTFLEARQPQHHPYELERTARDGPKWGPNIAVDAVVRVHRADGTSLLLRATDQMIERTD